MTCNACGEKPKKTCNDFTKAVIEINNPETLVLLRKVVIPASMGTEEQVPAVVGKYHNVILKYEANNHVYLYSSDGIPTLLEMDVPQQVLDNIETLQQEVESVETKLGRAIELTSEDYNYPEGAPDGIALWKLEEGMYFTENSVNRYLNTTESTPAGPATILIVKGHNSPTSSTEIYVFCTASVTSTITKADGTTQGFFTVQKMLGQRDIIDNLNSNSSTLTLSAKQGKVLNDKIAQNESFSTAETGTNGTWIDGSPIYKKTIDTGALPNATSKFVQHGVGTSLKRSIKIEGYAYSPNLGINMTIPDSEIKVQVAGVDIEIYTSTNLSMFTESYVTLYYTKTQ